MRRALSLVLVASLVALVPAFPAGAGPDRFRFFGAGFGHGLGMSQWGAYGLAGQGWGPARILTHFYSKTKVQAADTPPKTLRIGLVQGSAKVHLQAEAGDVRLVLGDPKTGDLVATIPSGETWLVRQSHQTFKVIDATGKLIATAGDPSTDLLLDYANARVHIPEASHTYNRGSIELALYSCGAIACDMRLVLTSSPQEYLYGLGEVPSSWPMAAMKAQAIAARTYAFTKAAAGQHRAGCDCALYASSYDQVYAGWDKEGGADGDRWVQAVDDTDGLVVAYQGQAIEAFYMSSSGGYTEDNENVWGGTPIPYLRGVCDPGDYTTANPSSTWIVTMTADDVTRDLRLGIGTVAGFANVQRGVSGRIISATVKGADGTATISGNTLRSELALRDDRVWINADRLVTGTIRDKYDALNCSPGLASTRQVQVAGGTRQRFEDGTIFASDATGAHLLSGALLDFYLDRKGGPEGKLGFPVGDQVELASGGSKAAFEHGAIHCTAAGACQVT
jgi:stage II sporulation protein D